MKTLNVNLRTTHISKTVLYQYKKTDSGKINEGIVASGRYFPGVLVENIFYYGINWNKRFLPGIIWNKSFIPGIITKRGFIPGIVTDNGFQFGIIAMGVFIPGIVIRSNFVPGIVRDEHFIPGCYTNEGHFAPGRFLKGYFDSGVVDSNTRSFILTNYETISVKTNIDIQKEGYGIKKIRRYEAIGGIPVSGAVRGIFDGGVGVIPSGFITNKWSIVGGFHKENLPHADILSELEQLGVDTSGFGVDGWSSTQDKWEQLADGLIDGKPGNPFGGGVDNNSLSNALASLGKGSDDLINDLNRNYDKYWKDAASGIKSSGGMITQYQGEMRWEQGHDETGAGEEEKEKDADNEGFIEAVSSVLNHVTAERLFGAAGGLAIIVIELVFTPISDTPLQPVNPPPKKESGSTGTNVSNGDDGELNEGGFTVGGWAGPKPIEVKNPNKRTSGIQIIQTDVGAMVVIDYDQLSEAMLAGPKEGIVIGLNPLTGDTISVIPGVIDPKAIFGQKVKKWYVNPKINPDKGFTESVF